jgi:hypothetical protein
VGIGVVSTTGGVATTVVDTEDPDSETPGGDWIPDESIVAIHDIGDFSGVYSLLVAFTVILTAPAAFSDQMNES